MVRQTAFAPLLAAGLLAATPVLASEMAKNHGNSQTMQTDADSKAGTTGESVDEAIQAVKEASKDARDQEAAETGSKAYEKLQALYAKVEEKSRDASGTAAEQWRQTKEQVDEMMQQAKATLGEWTEAADEKWDEIKVSLTEQYEKIARSLESVDEQS